jgi:hypothetical protein
VAAPPLEGLAGPPGVAWPPLGPLGVAGHPFDFSIFFLIPTTILTGGGRTTSRGPRRGPLGVAAPPLVHACGWLATHLIFRFFFFFNFFYTHHNSYRGWPHHPQRATPRPSGGGAATPSACLWVAGHPLGWVGHPFGFLIFFLVQRFFFFFFFFFLKN